MGRTKVVATVLGLVVLVTGPALAAASAFPTVERPDAEIEVRAAMDMSLHLGSVKGESRDR